jgi:hypothetical protein
MHANEAANLWRSKTCHQALHIRVIPLSVKMTAYSRILI